MLFRHMFYCKHVERQLCSVWISNKAAKQYSLHSAKWCVRPARPAAPLEAGLSLFRLQRGSVSQASVASQSVTRFTLRHRALAPAVDAGSVPRLLVQTCGWSVCQHEPCEVWGYLFAPAGAHTGR